MKGFSVVSWIKQSIISVLILGVVDLIFNYIETSRLEFTLLEWKWVLYIFILLFLGEIPAVKKLFNKPFFNNKK